MANSFCINMSTYKQYISVFWNWNLYFYSSVSYTSMLFKYFGHSRSHQRRRLPAADVSQITTLMENMEKLKEKQIYSKRTRLNKEHVFHALQTESNSVERLLDKFLTDLYLIKDSLANHSQMPGHLISVYCSISEDQFPDAWKSSCKLTRKTISSFLIHVGKKLDHFEEILGQPQDSVLVVDIAFFDLPSLFFNACKLEHIQGTCEDDSKDEWIAEVKFSWKKQLILLILSVRKII